MSKNNADAVKEGVHGDALTVLIIIPTVLLFWILGIFIGKKELRHSEITGTLVCQDEVLTSEGLECERYLFRYSNGYGFSLAPIRMVSSTTAQARWARQRENR